MNNKIILESNKISVSKNTENKVNEKLKHLQKIDIQKELMNLKHKEIDEENLNTNDITIKTKRVANKTVKGTGVLIKKILGTKSLLIFGGIIVFIFFISSVGSAIGSILSIAEGSSPRISEENKTKLLEMMKQLDSNCSKNLKNEFTVVGSKETDWRTVLALLLGYYENDLTTFNENVTEGSFSGNYEQMVEKASAMYGVDKWLICGIISTESDWRNLPPNRYMCRGFMQMSPDACAEIGFNYTDMGDIYMNVMAGTKYFKFCLDMFNGNVTLALAGYNAGPYNVKKYGGVPPFSETQQYVVKVPTRANYYKTGAWKIPSGNASGEVTGDNNSSNNSNNKLTDIYNLVNEVNSNHSTLTRHDFNEIIDKLNFKEEQKEIAMAIFEADLWEEVFGENFDYKFNITGSYLASEESIFNGVIFNTNGSRNSGQKIVDYALTQVGQVGGEPYWRYYGLTYRDAWCAMFVNWVMRTEPTNTGASYPTTEMTGNNAYCPTLVAWFKNNGRWADVTEYNNLVAGDIIFFHKYVGGESTHVGIVVGVSNGYVYTVEGNSGDMVKERKYEVTRKDRIMGYGLMNY